MLFRYINNYKYNLKESLEISKIKLLNYTIPLQQFNIVKNMNNIFSYILDNYILSITLDNNFYTIEELIDTLNSKQAKIIFSIDILNNKINVKSESNFKIIKTELSQQLGFTIYNLCTNNFVADNIYDLVIDNKVYIYLTNIKSEPFAVVSPEYDTNNSEYIFDSNIILDYIDIVFKNANGTDIIFNNDEYKIQIILYSIDK